MEALLAAVGAVQQHVAAGGLGEEDVADPEAEHAAGVLDRQQGTAIFSGLGHPAFDHLNKALIRDGLFQKAVSLHLVAFQGVLQHVGDEDDDRFAALFPKGPGGLHAVALRHLDVQKDQIAAVFAVLFQKLRAAFAQGHIELHAGFFAVFQQKAMERAAHFRFVVTNDDLDHGRSFYRSLEKSARRKVFAKPPSFR